MAEIDDIRALSDDELEDELERYAQGTHEPEISCRDDAVGRHERSRQGKKAHRAH